MIKCPYCDTLNDLSLFAHISTPQCSNCGQVIAIKDNDLKFTEMTMEDYNNWMNSQNEGKKFDQDKLRWDLFPFDAAEEIVKVLMFGAQKYNDWNWSKGIKFNRLFAAIMRHIWAWWRGETNDPETGLNHLAHVGCCIVFLLSYSKRVDYVTKYDNRPKYYQKNEELQEMKDGS